MSDQSQQKPVKAESGQKQQSRPNEQGSIVVQAHVKIYDPNTKRVYVEGRA